VEVATKDIVTLTGADTGNGTDGRISDNYSLVSAKRETRRKIYRDNKKQNDGE
jgi:hypothetical protein